MLTDHLPLKTGKEMNFPIREHVLSNSLTCPTLSSKTTTLGPTCLVKVNPEEAKDITLYPLQICRHSNKELCTHFPLIYVSIGERLALAGPLMQRPWWSKMEPWQGQSNVESMGFHFTTHFMCGHTAATTSTWDATFNHKNYKFIELLDKFHLFKPWRLLITSNVTSKCSSALSNFNVYYEKHFYR